MSALDPFKNMPKEPQLWDIEKKEQDNAEYNSMPVNFNEQKASLLKDLYGIDSQKDIYWDEWKNSGGIDNNKTAFDYIGSWIDEISDALYIWDRNDRTNKSKEPISHSDDLNKQWVTVNEKQEIFEIPEQIKESPYYPLLEWLFHSWQIKDSIFESVLEQLKEANKDEERDVIHIALVNITDRRLKVDLLEHFEWSNEKITEDNFDQSEFLSHSNSLNIDIDNWIWGLELLLANEYITIPNLSWEVNSQEDLERTMNIVSKVIIQKNSSDFKMNNADLITDIQNTSNLSDKYLILKKLYKQDLKTDAKLWWWKMKLEIARKQKSLKEKAEALTQQVIEWKNNNIKDGQELLEFDKKKKVIIAEALDLDVFEWEVFSSWILDTFDESIQQKNEQIS